MNTMQAVTKSKVALHKSPPGPEYRTTRMPSKPAQVAGEPVGEYLTDKDLKFRGWQRDRIRECLGEPDGTREVSGSVYDFDRGWFESYTRTRPYYRLERVFAAVGHPLPG